MMMHSRRDQAPTHQVSLDHYQGDHIYFRPDGIQGRGCHPIGDLYSSDSDSWFVENAEIPFLCWFIYFPFLSCPAFFPRTPSGYLSSFPFVRDWCPHACLRIHWLSANRKKELQTLRRNCDDFIENRNLDLYTRDGGPSNLLLSCLFFNSSSSGR